MIDCQYYHKKKRLVINNRNLTNSTFNFCWGKKVLTGGPCGGKTTALARLSSYLRDRGFEIFTVPEAFTILASNGFSMDYFAGMLVSLLFYKMIAMPIWNESYTMSVYFLY